MNGFPIALSFLIATLFVLTPSVCSSGEFKIAEIYDGTTVRAEGYDRQCLP